MEDMWKNDKDEWLDKCPRCGSYRFDHPNDKLPNILCACVQTIEEEKKWPEHIKKLEVYL